MWLLMSKNWVNLTPMTCCWTLITKLLSSYWIGGKKCCQWLVCSVSDLFVWTITVCDDSAAWLGCRFPKITLCVYDLVVIAEFLCLLHWLLYWYLLIGIGGISDNLFYFNITTQLFSTQEEERGKSGIFWHRTDLILDHFQYASDRDLKPKDIYLHI